MATFKNNLEKSILETVVYFDIFDYPLTIIEIWKWLWVDEQVLIENKKILDTQKILEKSETIKSLVCNYRGFYFLKGREEIVEFRRQKYNLAEKKFKKALIVARFLKFIPGVRMIAVCNDLAWSNAPEKSDIDIFLVTAKNKIWSVRFWAAGLFKFLGQRPSAGKTKDKICLSFLVDEENLNLEKIVSAKPDIYLIYWITQIVPIFDTGGIYEKFLEENEWIKKYLPNSFGVVSERRRTKTYAKRTSPSKIGATEKFFRWLQLRVMPEDLKNMANKDTRVIINNSMLKFHKNDRRKEYRDKWIKKISQLEN